MVFGVECLSVLLHVSVTVIRWRARYAFVWLLFRVPSALFSIPSRKFVTHNYQARYPLFYFILYSGYYSYTQFPVSLHQVSRPSLLSDSAQLVSHRLHSLLCGLRTLALCPLVRFNYVHIAIYWKPLHRSIYLVRTILLTPSENTFLSFATYYSAVLFVCTINLSTRHQSIVRRLLMMSS